MFFQCIQEFCEQDFIESCFEELFEEEERFAEEMERYLESLTSDQVDQLVHQLDAATLNDAGKESPCEIIFEKVSTEQPVLQTAAVNSQKKLSWTLRLKRV